MSNPPLEDLDWIPGDVLEKVRGEGVLTLIDLAFAPTHLLQRCGLSRDEAVKLTERAVEGFGYLMSGSRIVERGVSRLRVSTGSSSLDGLLGGGVSTGVVTDFYGRSGAGKTQICFQLCVNTQLKTSREGGWGDVVFVDTAGTFRPERIAEIAAGRVDREELFRHILLVKARSSTSQAEIPHRLDELARDHTVKLLIIDTLTDNFVYEFQGEDSLIDRQTALARHLHDLASTAIDRDLAVVVTNTVRARMSKERGSFEVEAGGNTVSQGVHLQVKLERLNRIWSASLAGGGGTVEFNIGRFGVTDLEG